ncbi:MAG: hypothetical protein MK116_02725 [Phycisphaerales bacterium]|nr:hypothetical protein [Phycisphaerales bacterium]
MTPPSGDAVPLHLVEEVEAGDGWTFRFTIDIDEDHSRTIEIRMAWVDYNLWCPSGSARPSDVSHAVMRLFLASLPPESVPARLDAARIRRLVSDADTQVPTLIQAHPR